VLYWFLTAEFQKYLWSISTRAAQPGFNIVDMKGFLIPLPPLAEQQRIVALLDEAFAGIDEAMHAFEEQAKLSGSLLESHLSGVFSTRRDGWEATKLEDCATIIMGQSPDGSSYNSKSVGVPLINGPVEFSEDSFGETIESKWTTEPTKLCRKGDLILCVRGSTTGRMNIAGVDSCIGRGVAAIRAKQVQGWINHFINASRPKILGMGKGATFPNVSANQIGLMELMLPPPDVQERLSSEFNELRFLNSKLGNLFERRATSMTELKKAFLTQAFAGELTD
jgi:type I restriction enzyme S subunit